MTSVDDGELGSRRITRRDGSFAMGADYIPERDIKAAIWMKHFAAVLIEHPELYRTTAQDAAEIDALVLAFRVANAKCGRPITNSPVARRAKNEARIAAERLLRPAATRINRDPRIAANLKVSIGLKPRTKRRHRIDPPQTVPVLSLRADRSGRMHVRVHDSQSLRRAKPKSAVGLQLFERIIPRDVAHAASAAGSGAVPNVGADETPPGWRFVGLFTRALFVFDHAAKATGDQASYVARWYTRPGKPGRFGNISTINAIASAGVRPSGLQFNRRAA
jgi:hypothetical protein